MNCPRCQQAFQSNTYEKINIDNCPHCGGVWLDAGELLPIITARDALFTRDLVEKTLKRAHTKIPKAEQDVVLSCPHCSGAMHPLNYNYSSGIVLNACPNGHGVWLDKDELAGVQIHMEHWDQAKDQAKWQDLLKQTRQNEAAAQEQLQDKDNHKSGPIGKAIDAIMDMISDVSSKS